ncbi:helix-turn-helix transcriptional regulator [Microbacterium sp. cx-59]|uniref:helix-turn-helix transcriptional regulator n=1 Tax=Microbacterium sp. cx-59 TaxID=2891207 RepID=UPI001E3ED9FF|nr:helix-turn-helix transcriptional regulator [Microbacterium sp. cx-59]MCC4909438.1 LuxR C-terminal-related transcriptional regulator [Microbacterium sp. cx-59]
MFASRPTPTTLEMLAGIAVHRLDGLDALSAVALLNARSPRQFDPHLAVRVAAQLDGHPLAITDLASHADAERLALRALSLEPLPPGALLEDFYLQQVRELPASAVAFALLAATDTTGAADVVRQAADERRLPPDASTPLENAKLLEVGVRMRFRHQLIRSAVYNGASSADRRKAHIALEGASHAQGFVTAAAMHASAVAVAPDIPLAARLAALADAAGGRGALLAQAGLLARSAELTPVGVSHDEHQIAAVEAALGAGAALLAREMLDALDFEALTPEHRGRALSARAFVALFIADADSVPLVASMFARAADAFRPVSAVAEQHALINAYSYVWTTERRTTGIELTDFGERLQTGADSAPGPHAEILRGLAAHILGPIPDSLPPMRETMRVIDELDDDAFFEVGASAVPLGMALADPHAALDVTRRLVDIARARGALQALDSSLWMQSTIHVQLLDIAAAGHALENIRELRRAIGYPAEHVVNAAHLALAGAPRGAVDTAGDAARDSGFTGAWTVAQRGLGCRLVAEGEYREAYLLLRPLVENGFLHVAHLSLADYAEASGRSGYLGDARAATASLEGLATATPTPWMRGLAHRSRALLASTASAEGEFLAAIQQFEQIPAPGDLARTHLLYGEWLRRQRRRRDARVHLARAVRSFDALGVVPFATRARHEFAATGDVAPPPASESDLSPQESLIATLAAEGRSNPEIAAALFISPHTVDYHLRKIFRKLGITSRRQLTDARRT